MEEMATVVIDDIGVEKVKKSDILKNAFSSLGPAGKAGGYIVVGGLVIWAVCSGLNAFLSLQEKWTGVPTECRIINVKAARKKKKKLKEFTKEVEARGNFVVYDPVTGIYSEMRSEDLLHVVRLDD